MNAHATSATYKAERLQATDSDDSEFTYSLRGAVLRVSLRNRALHDKMLAKIIQEIERLLPVRADGVELDCSQITELCGPYGMLFAMLLKLSRDHGLSVRMIGLRGQPQTQAELFSQNRPVAGITNQARVATEYHSVLDLIMVGGRGVGAGTTKAVNRPAL